MNFTLCVLASASTEKYQKRLLDFIDHYGFKKTNSKIKLKIVFLVSNEARPEYIPNEYIWYDCKNTPYQLRFLEYLKKEPSDYDWIMQVDDDSSTDIDKTCEILNQYYDFEDCMALTCGHQYDIDGNLQNVIRDMDISNFFFMVNNSNNFERIPYVIHAWEASILSKKASIRLKEWNKFEEFIEKCKIHKPKFSDQAPYIAFKLAKIPICQGTFMTPMYKYKEYTAINKYGRYAHIHYVTKKQNNYQEFNKKMQQIKKGEYIMQEQNLWKYYAKDNGVFRHIAIISLNADGTIGKYNHRNEKFWEKKNNKIYIINENKIPFCILSEDSSDMYSGEVLSNPNTIHYLERY